MYLLCILPDGNIVKKCLCSFPAFLDFTIYQLFFLSFLSFSFLFTFFFHGYAKTRYLLWCRQYSIMTSLTALVCLKNHILVFHSDTFYVYTESLKENPGTDLNNPGLPFPLHSLDLLAVNRNLLLCCPAPNTLAVYQFEAVDKDTLKPPVVIAQWMIPEDTKISVACWAESHAGLDHVLLGTRDGAILRLDLQKPGVLLPVSIDGMPSLQSATVSNIAAAPCGNRFYAVGYASGLIAIYQDLFENGLKTIHCIDTPKKVLALSWHYSAKNMACQSLATLRAGSDRLHIYTVDVSSSATPPRKIRDIALPSGQSIPSICSKFLQWSKSGKVVRVSDSGLIVSDVRTKKVITRSISLPPPVVTLDVKSSKGKVWAVDCEGCLASYNLMDGSLIDSTTLPFYLELQESAAILDSPVVFIHRPTQVNAVTYKNKRALKSPLTETHNQSPSPTLVSKTHRPTFSVSSAISNTSTLPGNSSPTASQTIQLSMLPVKAVVNSLFPLVLKTLSRMPQQDVPEFIPSLSTKEQYAISAIFGGVYNTSLCLGGIHDILSHNLYKDLGTFRSLVISLLLSEIPLNHLIATLSNLPGERTYSDRFVFTLLSIGSITGGAQDSYSSSSLRTNCNLAVVNLVQDLVNTEDLSMDDLHLICAYLVSIGYAIEARTIYLASSLFLEAFVVSLLGKFEFISVFCDWCSYLRTTTLNPNLLCYLMDICTNLEGVPRHSTASTTSSEDNPVDEDLVRSYSLTRTSCAIDDVAIFSPELVSEEFAPTSTESSTCLPAMSPNRLKLMSTPKYIPNHNYSSSSVNMEDPNMVKPLARLTVNRD